MAYLSLDFLLLLLGALFAFHAVGDARWRTAVLLLASGAFLASFAARPAELLPLGAFLALGFALVQLSRRKPPPWVFGLSVGAVVFAFAYLRRYSALAALPTWQDAWVTVGLSYVLFRVLHLMADDYQAEAGAQPKVGPVAYLLYTCSFLTLVSGPIQRFEDHRAQAWKLGAFTLDAAAVHAGFSRLANGYLKVALVSAVLLRAHQACAERLGGGAGPGPSWLWLAAAALAYTSFLYANFSGSIDLVLGAGALFGFALPENFDRPFLAGNLLDFWGRWHITLSQWFKVYVFNPLLKLFGRWLKTPRQLLYGGVAGYFLTFALMGAWHGTTFAFFLYGLLLGAGVAGAKLYELEVGRRLGKKAFAALRAQPLYLYAARGFTLSYFALALALWWLPLPRAGELGAGAWLLAFGALGLLVGALHAAWVVLAALGRAPGKAIAGLSTSVVGQQLWLAARAFAIAALGFDSGFHVPELIYQGF